MSVCLRVHLHTSNRFLPLNTKFYSFQLFALFVAELPWDEPTSGCGEYLKWKHDNSWMTISPWKKIGNIALSLLRKMLDPEPAKRITLEKIISHKWCTVLSGESSAQPVPTFIVFSLSFSYLSLHATL